MCSSSLERTPKLQLAAEQPWTGECWIPPRKDTPCPGAKEKPQKYDRRGEITFRIKDHTHQRCSEGSKKKKLVHTRIKRSHRGMLDLCLNLLKRYGSAVTCHRGKGSGCSYLGHTACGISPLGGGHH